MCDVYLCVKLNNGLHQAALCACVYLYTGERADYRGNLRAQDLDLSMTKLVEYSFDIIFRISSWS